MAYVDLYNVYIYVPKLRIPKFKQYLLNSGIAWDKVDGVKRGVNNFYQMQPKTTTSKPVITDAEVRVYAIGLHCITNLDAIPDNAYLIKITDLKNIKSILKLQGMGDVDIPMV